VENLTLIKKKTSEKWQRQKSADWKEVAARAAETRKKNKAAKEKEEKKEKEKK